MRSLLAALAIIAGAAAALGPDEAEARQRQKPGCTTPKFETPIAQVPIAPPVQYQTPAPIPLQTFVSPPTYVQTPDQTVTIPGQTVTFQTPAQTVVIPGERVEVPGTVQTYQQVPVVPYAQPYAAPICPDEAPKRPLKTFIEQRRLKREKHLGMEEAAAEPEKETSAACKRCKKRFRGWYDEPVLVA